MPNPYRLRGTSPDLLSVFVDDEQRCPLRPYRFAATRYNSLHNVLQLLFLGGLGIAAFHPQGATGVAAIAPHRRGMVLAIFVTCGTIGHSIGPVFFSKMTEWLGLEMLYWAALPGVVVSGVLLWGLGVRATVAVGNRSRFDYEAVRAKWKPLLLHYVLVLLRSVVQVGMAQFMTLYLYRERGLTFSQASLGLTTFFASAALGTFVGGGLAERFGSRRIVVLSMTVSVPFLFLFVGATGWASFAGLFVGGFMLLLTNPVLLALAQELVPTQESTVSGLMMGFAWGVAGIVFVPLIGWLADHFSLQPLLGGLALLVAATMASHGLLDMLTDGGHGVALAWPLSDERWFAPIRPIAVSQITNIFTLYQAQVFGLEALLFGLPLETDAFKGRDDALNAYEVYREIAESLKRQIEALGRKNI